MTTTRSKNAYGLFAQTSVVNEYATAFLQLLPSAVDAEPEPYQQEDETSLAAIAILKRHPELLFKKGIVTDHFGRKIYASPYQLFLGAGDTWALKQLHEIILPNIEKGVDRAQEQFKEQFPHCQKRYDPKIGEAMLYDDRNRAQVKQVNEHLKIITASITADPCTNGQATRPETTQAVAMLHQIFKPKEDEIIRTGLHFPLAILHEIYKLYDAQLRSWGGDRLSFYAREVIGAAEAALTAVDGQWCKNGLAHVDMTQGPDRRDGLFCRHPKGIPEELAPISDKLGRTMLVDLYSGQTSVAAKDGVHWYTKDGDEILVKSCELRWVHGYGAVRELMENKCRDLLAMRPHFHASTRHQRGRDHNQPMRCVIL